MRRIWFSTLAVLLVAGLMMFLPSRRTSAQTPPADPAADAATKFFTDGRQIFRFDTFGDQAFWGGQPNFIRPSKVQNWEAWEPA